MPDQKNRPKDAADLRQKAEALARERVDRISQDSAALSPEEIRKTLHELRVHQIELELQNEELRQAQDKIEAGRARYFDLYDLAPVGYCTLSEQGLILEANLTAATLLGTARNALVKQPISRFILKEDQDICYLHRKKLFETGETQECELRLVRPDGATFWGHLTGTTAQAEDGTLLCRVVISDITERMRAEEALRVSEKLLSRAQEISHTGSWKLDLTANRLTWSDEVYRIFGCEPQEFAATYEAFLDFVHPDDRAAVDDAYSRSLREGSDGYEIEHRIVRRNSDEVRYVHERCVHERDDAGTLIQSTGMVQDITERKKAEIALTDEIENRRILLDNIHTQVWYLTGEHAYGAVNRAHAEFNGRTVEDMSFKDLYDIFPKDVDRVCHQGNHEVFTTGRPIRTEEWVPHVSGVPRLLSISKTPKSREDGTVEYVVCSAEDITERKRIEEALLDSEQKVRKKLDSLLSPEGDIDNLGIEDIFDTQAIQQIMDHFYRLTNIGVAITDLHGKILVATGWQEVCTKFHRVHPEARRNCVESDKTLSAGVSPGEFKLYKCKNNMWDIVTPIYVGDKHLANLFLGQFFFEDEDPDIEVFRNQAQKFKFDEKEYLAAVSRVPRWSRETINAVMSFYSEFASMVSMLNYRTLRLARALEERKQLQSQLLQAQKMESVGLLAGGIAHDFNNLLHVMGGNLEFLDMKLAEDHPGKKRIPTIQKSMNRAAHLVRQMLLFSRKARTQRQDMDLNQEIQRAAEMLERTIPKMVSIELDLDKEAWFINADPIQVEQVLLNLATNAVDAMPDGGRLIIETINVDVDEALANEHTELKSGQYVLLTVSDTGCGMDEETLDKVFDPFFTTKEVGKGTGLGLASAYGIVKAHDGYITCESKPDKGTTFKIYWPGVNTKLSDD